MTYDQAIKHYMSSQIRGIKINMNYYKLKLSTSDFEKMTILLVALQFEEAFTK